MGQARNAHNILVAYPEGNIPLGRPRHWSGNNIKVDHEEICWEGIGRFHLA
jgi:hypothetical protein